MEGIPYLVVMVIALQTDISGTKFLCALQQFAVILSQKDEINYVLIHHLLQVLTIINLSPLLE